MLRHCGYYRYFHCCRYRRHRLPVTGGAGDQLAQHRAQPPASGGGLQCLHAGAALRHLASPTTCLSAALCLYLLCITVSLYHCIHHFTKHQCIHHQTVSYGHIHRPRCGHSLSLRCGGGEVDCGLLTGHTYPLEFL